MVPPQTLLPHQQQQPTSLAPPLPIASMDVSFQSNASQPKQLQQQPSQLMPAHVQQAPSLPPPLMPTAVESSHNLPTSGYGSNSVSTESPSHLHQSRNESGFNKV